MSFEERPSGWFVSVLNEPGTWPAFERELPTLTEARRAAVVYLAWRLSWRATAEE